MKTTSLELGGSLSGSPHTLSITGAGVVMLHKCVLELERLGTTLDGAGCIQTSLQHLSREIFQISP